MGVYPSSGVEPYVVVADKTPVGWLGCCSLQSTNHHITDYKKVDSKNNFLANILWWIKMMKTFIEKPALTVEKLSYSYLKPCPHWRLSPKPATVAELGDYSRQCGQGFTLIYTNEKARKRYSLHVFSKLYNRNESICFRDYLVLQKSWELYC